MPTPKFTITKKAQKARMLAKYHALVAVGQLPPRVAIATLRAAADEIEADHPRPRLVYRPRANHPLVGKDPIK